MNRFRTGKGRVGTVALRRPQSFSPSGAKVAEGRMRGHPKKLYHLKKMKSGKQTVKF